MTPNTADSVCLMRVRGSVDMDGVIAKLTTYFQDHATPVIIWDVRGADVSNVGIAELKRLAETLAQWDEKRGTPRGAGVIDPGLMHMLARLFAAMNTARGRPARFRTFLNISDALAWLEMKDMPAEWVH